MNPSLQFCPNEKCLARGKVGEGNIGGNVVTDLECTIRAIGVQKEEHKERVHVKTACYKSPAEENTFSPSFLEWLREQFYRLPYVPGPLLHYPPPGVFSFIVGNDKLNYKPLKKSGFLATSVE